LLGGVMVFNVTFNNISVILWQSIVLVQWHCHSTLQAHSGNVPIKDEKTVVWIATFFIYLDTRYTIHI
jgi:hypothetical protein